MSNHLEENIPYKMINEWKTLSPTRTNAPVMSQEYCGVCPKPSTETCANCLNMPYCSRVCRKKDAENHAPLCSTLLGNHTSFRPSPSHYRCIFFPADVTEPRFVWLKYDGPPGQLETDREYLRSYVTGVPSGGDAAFDCFREGNRQLRNRIVVHHDSNSLGNKQPYNECVMELLGRVAGEHWRGPLLAQSYKYRIDDDLEAWVTEDRPRGSKPLIPIDLDTTSLAPVLSFLHWRSISADDYGLNTDAGTMTPSKAFPRTPPKKASPKSKNRNPAQATQIKDEYDGETEVCWNMTFSEGWAKM